MSESFLGFCIDLSVFPEAAFWGLALDLFGTHQCEDWDIGRKENKFLHFSPTETHTHAISLTSLLSTYLAVTFNLHTMFKHVYLVILVVCQNSLYDTFINILFHNSSVNDISVQISFSLINLMPDRTQEEVKLHENYLCTQKSSESAKQSMARLYSLLFQTSAKRSSFP